jgi:two-component system NtrC family sensor kinase
VLIINRTKKEQGEKIRIENNNGISIHSINSSIEINSNVDEKIPIKILHVDDDSELLFIMKECLEQTGFEVDSALSVDEALDKMKKITYDAIISDYLIPGKNGLKFLKELREKGNTIPFIILTGKGLEEVATQALNLGADHYINKNENPELMFSEITKVLINLVERKRTYLDACLRQKRLKATMDSSPNAIMIIDQQGIITECNFEMVRLTLASSRKEIIGQNMLSFVEEKDRQRLSKSLNAALEQDKIKSVEFGLLTKIGKGLNVELSARAIQGTEKKPTSMVVTLNDITERKLSENKLLQYSKRLEENRRFLENIFAAFPNAVTVCDLNGNIIKCNQATLNLHGYSSERELIGVNLFALLLQADCERAKKELETVRICGSKENLEFMMVRRGGDEFPGELSFGRIMDSSHNALGVLVVAKDITDRKFLQDQLVISEKLAAVGRLAAVFSHDIRNPLAVINNSACFLEMKLKENTDEKVLKHLQILKEEITFADLMVNDLLDLTRKNPPCLEEADLNEIVRSALCSLSISENVKMVFNAAGDLPKLLLDRAQLLRVFMNLFANALQAMPEGGNLIIQSMKDYDAAEVSVADTGIGMSVESLGKLFTPFFTTKKNGVGLGLSICNQIVEAHGGELTVKSIQGQGSTFTVQLPIRLKEMQENQFCRTTTNLGVRK